jgi:magnesium-transporting ATPase (P-type)
LEGLRMENVEIFYGYLKCFMDIWNIYGHLGYFMTIWYISWWFGTVFPVWVSCNKKNLATMATTTKPFMMQSWSSKIFQNFLYVGIQITLTQISGLIVYGHTFIYGVRGNCNLFVYKHICSKSTKIHRFTTFVCIAYIHTIRLHIFIPR